MRSLPLNEAADSLGELLVAMRFQPTHQLITTLLIAPGRTAGLFVFRLVLMFGLSPSGLNLSVFTIFLVRLLRGNSTKVSNVLGIATSLLKSCVALNASGEEFLLVLKESEQATIEITASL